MCHVCITSERYTGSNLFFGNKEADNGLNVNFFFEEWDIREKQSYNSRGSCSIAGAELLTIYSWKDVEKKWQMQFCKRRLSDDKKWRQIFENEGDNQN